MRVQVGGQWHREETLKNVDLLSLHEHEREAVQFIREWKDGKQAFTFHTSGSTGTPKPIIFHRSQLEASARITIEALPLKPGMTALVCLDTRFVAGAMMLVRSMLIGMNIIIRRPSGNPLVDVSDPVDFMAVVPLQLAVILRESVDVLDRIANVIVGGAPLDEPVVKMLQQRRGTFFATYGMTETITHVALRCLNGPGQQDAFHLLPGFSATSDFRGCLILRAAHLGDESIETNDLVQFVTPSTFHIHGRIDDVINSGGVKIQPAHIEDLLRAILPEAGYHFRFFVAGVPDERLGERVCLLIEHMPLADMEEKKLMQLVTGGLEKFETPREIRYVKTFLETPTGKIDRRATLRTGG